MLLLLLLLLLLSLLLLLLGVIGVLGPEGLLCVGVMALLCVCHGSLLLHILLHGCADGAALALTFLVVLQQVPGRQTPAAEATDGQENILRGSQKLLAAVSCTMLHHPRSLCIMCLTCDP